MSKSTMKELPEELEALEALDAQKYAYIIDKAKKGYYHDYKEPEDGTGLSKMTLMQDLDLFPELEHIRRAVMSGDYDEKPDAEDLEMLKRETPHHMWKMLGLE